MDKQSLSYFFFIPNAAPHRNYAIGGAGAWSVETKRERDDLSAHQELPLRTRTIASALLEHDSIVTVPRRQA